MTLTIPDEFAGFYWFSLHACFRDGTCSCSIRDKTLREYRGKGATLQQAIDALTPEPQYGKPYVPPAPAIDLDDLDI